MDIEALIKAAQEIDYLAQTQEERTKQWQQLASDAKSGNFTREEIDKRRRALDSTKVVDFGTAVQNLRRALKSRKKIAVHSNRPPNCS